MWKPQHVHNGEDSDVNVIKVFAAGAAQLVVCKVEPLALVASLAAPRARRRLPRHRPQSPILCTVQSTVGRCGKAVHWLAGRKTLEAGKEAERECAEMSCEVYPISYITYTVNTGLGGGEIEPAAHLELG